jgi:iron complex transport system ATP-binding protein
MPSEVSLEAVQVSYRYGDRAVLRDVSLGVKRGTMLALAGPNGSGKTTLLRVMLGARRPADGEVRIHGTSVRAIPPRDRARLIAVVPQNVNPALAFHVEELVAMGRTPYARAFAPRSSEDRRALAKALSATEIESIAGRRFSELSGGEQQRVVLAMALAQDTPFLLLDEPTVHLDLHHQHDLLELLRRLCGERDLGILAVMHDLNLASLYFDRLAVLHRGRMVAEGVPGEVMVKPEVLRVFRAPLVVVSHPQMGVPQVLLQRGTRSADNADSAEV